MFVYITVSVILILSWGNSRRDLITQLQRGRVAGEPRQLGPLVHHLNHHPEFLCGPSVDVTLSCSCPCALSIYTMGLQCGVVFVVLFQLQTDTHWALRNCLFWFIDSNSGDRHLVIGRIFISFCIRQRSFTLSGGKYFLLVNFIQCFS